MLEGRVMKNYGNLYGNSSIIEYDAGKDYISVKFRDGRVYTYSYSKAGSYHVENMKKLAEQGYGLNSYIMKNVRNKYD